MARRARGSVNDRPPKWKLFLRRQRWMLRPLGWLCACGVAVAAGALLLRTAQPGSSIASVRERIGTMTAGAGMRIRDIEIEGRANTPEPILRAALGVSKGDPIIGFSLEQARAQIEKLTWVAHATVERRLPDTIVVVLTERRPFAVWQFQDKYVLIDRDGQPVSNEELSKYHDLPLIVGAGAPVAARALLDALTDRPVIQEHVVAAMRIGERRWNLRLKNHADVLLPEDHEIEALDRLSALQRDIGLLDRPLQTIDLRLPDKLVLRPATAQRTEPAGADKSVPPPAPPAPKKPA
jgi:cell division protein FtsQ